MRMISEDPLAALVVDEADLAREELAGALKPFLRLTRDGGFVFERSFDSLRTKQRVACLLLAFKAAHLLGFRTRPGAAPQEIVEVSGIPPGSVRPKLSELVQMRLAAKSGRDYFIPAHAARRVVQLLGGEE